MCVRYKVSTSFLSSANSYETSPIAHPIQIHTNKRILGKGFNLFKMTQHKVTHKFAVGEKISLFIHLWEMCYSYSSFPLFIFFNFPLSSHLPCFSVLHLMHQGIHVVY